MAQPQAVFSPTPVLARIWRPFDNADAPARRLSKIRAFETIFVMILVAEYWARAIPKWGALADIYVVSLGLATMLGPLTLLWPARRAAFAALAAVHAVIIWREFPAAGNHAYFELMLCSLAAFLDPRRPEEQRLYVGSVRWMVCVILVYGGLQKAVHGYYARGQFLLYSLGATPWFATVLAAVVPADEFARLAAYKGQVGDGPYLVGGWTVPLLSNAVVALEIALAVLLVIRRTRMFGVAATVAFIAAIEIGAREIFFGLVFVNAVLLFAPGDLNRRLVGVFAAVLAALMLVRVGVLPEMVFY